MTNSPFFCRVVSFRQDIQYVLIDSSLHWKIDNSSRNEQNVFSIRLITRVKLTGFTSLYASFVFSEIVKAIVVCYYLPPLNRKQILYFYQYIRLISKNSNGNSIQSFGFWPMWLFSLKRSRCSTKLTQLFIV